MGHGVDLDAEPRGRLVDQVDGLVAAWTASWAFTVSVSSLI
jgi:hypothetical protein